ncbi:MAG TPA: hypothetical protein VHY56_11030 [Candidatus Binataceae bacterium]|jgi:hypothetical protein|nr:hypothetical protein [Candidatus Binataceae bacterium]
MPSLNIWVAIGVMISTASTDAVYVLFNGAVSSRLRVRAASWSSIWYLLSAFAVVSYTKNPAYVVFAAAGSWFGAFGAVTWLKRTDARTALGPQRAGTPEASAAKSPTE